MTVFFRFSLIFSSILLYLPGCDSGTNITSDAGSETDSDIEEDHDTDIDENSDGDSTADGDVAPGVCPEGYFLGDYHNKPVFEIEIQGQAYQFVSDTGAPGTAIDDDLIDGLGKGPYELSFAGQIVELPSFYVMDMAQIAGSDDIDGIVGTNVMGNFSVTLDRQRNRYWVTDDTEEANLLACDHVEGQPSSLEYLDEDYLFVQGNAEGREGWFLIDTGATLGAMPEQCFDILQSAHPRPTLSGFYTQAAIGTFWSKLAAIGYLEVGNHRVEHIMTRTIANDSIWLPASLGDLPFLGVLPTGYLRHFLVTVDYPHNIIRLDPYHDDPMREPSEYFAFGFSFEASTELPLLIASILPGSSAEEQGLQVGDEVTSVFGHQVASLTPSQRSWLTVSPDEGLTATVIVQRAGEEMTFVVEARDILTDPLIEE